MIENRRKKGWRRAGARYLRVGDKSARLNRGVKGGRSGTGGGRGERARRTDGRTRARYRVAVAGREKERERRVAGREGGGCA